MSTNCVIYARCSTDKQAKHGQSIPMQISECNKFAIDHGWKVKGIFKDEGISGKSRKNRIGFDNALNLLTKGDILLVYSTSRISRNKDDKIEIKAKLLSIGAKISSVTENFNDPKIGFMLEAMTDFMDSSELDTMKTRIKSGMNKKRQETGTCNFKATYGYKFDKNKKDEYGKYVLIPILYEQNIIREIKRMRDTIYYDGRKKTGQPTPYRVIADYLNTKFHTRNKSKKTGEYKKWQASTVGKIYEREKDIDTEKIISEINIDIPEENIKEVVTNCIYVIIKNSIRYIGKVNQPYEIFKNEKVKKFQVHIYPCDSNGSNYLLFTSWLHSQRYIDPEVDENMILPNVDINIVLQMMKQITEKEPTILTVSEIPTVFPEIQYNTIDEIVNDSSDDDSN